MSNVSTEYAIAKLQSRMDASYVFDTITEIKNDRAQVQCNPGQKKCGKACISDKKSCFKEGAKAFGGGAVQALAGPIGSGTYRTMRQRGNGRAKSAATGIAVGLGASIAGAVALNAGANAIVKRANAANAKDLAKINAKLGYK